ncbi:hypothetical protein NDU88_003183 [Pleurodeles waltl]|uniref:Uncharacterized protein n=1 Tax=Pleurodeles waltl TaxID=8319 RepID=A0AAV7NFP4_PLEWA|nr:hypothetical protein NDU88_003183 [Pleurodeles waltl]
MSRWLRPPPCCCVFLGLAPLVSAARPQHSFEPVSALWPRRRHPLSRSAPGLSCSDQVPPPHAGVSLSLFIIYLFTYLRAPFRVLIFGGAGVFQRGSAGVPGESLATLTLLRGAVSGPPPSPFCSSVQPCEFLICPGGQIPCSSLPRLRAQVPIVRRSGPTGSGPPPHCCASLGLAPRISAVCPQHSLDPVSALRPQRRHPLSRSTPGLSCSDQVPPPHAGVSLSLFIIYLFKGTPQGADLIFGGADVFQWGSARVPGDSLATLTLLRGVDFGPPPSPFCSSVQPRKFLMCPGGQILCSLCPNSGRRCRLSGDQGPLAPPDSLLLCFFGARSSGLRSTPSALLRSSERPPAPAPSPAKSIRSRSHLLLERRRLSQRWPRAHTRVPGCTGPARQTALKFPSLHRSLSATLRSGSTVFEVSSTALPLCDCGLPPRLGVDLTGLFVGPSGAPNLCVRHLRSYFYIVLTLILYYLFAAVNVFPPSRPVCLCHTTETGL